MAVTHGDEPSWIAAHDFLISFFQENELNSGELVLILWNYEAYQQGKICVEENLNRLFRDDSLILENQRSTIEYVRSRELMSIISSLDYLLDIHSTNNPGPVFAIIKNDDSRRWEIASHLPVEFVSGGWNPYITWTTCDWMEASGWIGVTIECGDHRNPLGWEVAVRAAKAFIQVTGCHNFWESVDTCHKRFRVLLKESVNDPMTFEYSREYVNFEEIDSKEEIAHDSGKKYLAPDQEGLAIVFPTKIESIRSGAIKEAYLLGEFF